MTTRPNILLILSDQHSPHAAGFAGNADVDTPALDVLAASGAIFDAAYCQSPLCVPSRMSLWSGRYAHRCAAWDNRSLLSDGVTTIPGWLAAHGYTTAAVGKMHFRGAEQNHGFQQRPYGDLVDTPVLIHQPDPPETVDGRAESHRVGRFPFAGVSSIPESLHLDTVVTTESLAWLLDFTDEHPDQPWFFCASYYRPHFPLTAPGRYIRKYEQRGIQRFPVPPGYPDALHPHDRYIVDDFNLLQFSDVEHAKALAAYYALVEYVDTQIERLLAGLCSAGLLENTLIVYTADHGELAGEHGLWWKRSYYDSSAGVPLLVAGPGVVAGQRITTPVELVDLFPTFCDWAGIPTPDDIDGESLLPLVRGEPQRRRKRTAISELLGEMMPVRFRMARDERWKYVSFPGAPPRLFDLQTDPGEATDLWPNVPPEVPLDALQALLPEHWAELAQRREAQYAAQPPFQRFSRSAAHYKLRDGRIIEADDHLYDGRSVGSAP